MKTTAIVLCLLVALFVAYLEYDAREEIKKNKKK